MLKKVVKNLLIFLVGFAFMAPFAAAQESSLPDTQELIKQIQTLQAEISQIKETVKEAREIAVDSRLEAEKFKEETLYRLGLWRSRLGEGMMMSASAQGAAQRAEDLATTANEKVKLVLDRIGEVEKRFDVLSSKVEEEVNARAGIENNVNLLSQDVESLKTDVSLAKEMAATAKAQADQAQLDTQRLAGEVRKNRELFLSKIEKILGEMKKKEEKFKAEKVELKAPSGMIYRVKKGDSLWRIAGYPDIYNNPNKWKKIFEANKDRLSSPNLIYPGQKLIIPQE
ncbi:LysM peptidoglycan-binding domain-containing protein [Candidatus Aerophobetes bacterium]|nr:LysM peptidoglycan-binding domain-containing protein [Candidatus Aerophobetes bacterium]